MYKISTLIFKFFLVSILIIVLLNFPAITKQSINGQIRVFKIPIYIKIIEFLDRNFWYKKISKDITADRITDREKVLAIFNWVTENIHQPPDEFDVIDDHVLNIFIRRYGTGDQSSDLFTTLCAYSDIPAFWQSRRLRQGGEVKALTISYALLNNKWRVFDLYHKWFFLNQRGEIASVEDIISDIGIVKKKNITFGKIAYEDFFKDMKPINKNFISKEEKQMPIYRLLYELKCLFRMGNENEIDNNYIIAS